MLEQHWTTEGYAAPNAVVYPWQWLWDSCFHSLIWQALGETDRAVTELRSALATQTASGFVPHMNYQIEPQASLKFWGRTGASSITQPPMYGHVVAELLRAGVEVDDDVMGRAQKGVRFFLEVRPRHESGLVALCHPWESGADDSPRWDDLCPDGWTVDRWRIRKGYLVESLRRGNEGEALENPDFAVASVGFNALVAWNAIELGGAVNDDPLVEAGQALASMIDDQWDPAAGTWVDAGPTESGSGRCRTGDALLPLLVSGRKEAISSVIDQLKDPQRFGGPFGPPGVDRTEKVFDPDAYWRGPVWPQLSYLLVQGVKRVGGEGLLVEAMAKATVDGAMASGLAEYWNPDTGEGRGAMPQSWAGLALLLQSSF